MKRNNAPPAAQPAELDSSAPTLRVMRLQKPQLHVSTSQSNDKFLLSNALTLPDSLGVFVGETFTAYLGIINSNTQLPIRRLTVTAQLQSPSQRWQLPSQLDQGNLLGGIDVSANSSIDAIVSHAIEEPGQHILRVEVGYLSPEGGTKTFRKFYRFQVTSPLQLSATSIRAGDTACFVAVMIESLSKDSTLFFPAIEWSAAEGLSAKRIPEKEACRVLDDDVLLQPGATIRVLFRVEASSKEAVLKGIAAGDVLGRAMVTWRKSMGEAGTVVSDPILCPIAKPDSSHFVVHRSGLSVDVAAAAATRHPTPEQVHLRTRLPVTVEPIDPPSKMQLHCPKDVKFLVVNHSEEALTLQLQFHLSQMTGLVVCGTSFQSLGQVKPQGGSCVVSVRFLPLAAGLLRAQGCLVIDVVTGDEIEQPPLFQVFVESNETGTGGVEPALIEEYRSPQALNE